MTADDVSFDACTANARARLRAESGGWRADGSAVGARLLEQVPDAIGRLAARLPRGVVLVSGTNGKTTTNALVAAVLGAAGMHVVTNSIGANLPGGIAAELVAASGPDGRLTGDVGAFEVDELSLLRVVEHHAPDVLVLCNVFRDQLDRCGEIGRIVDDWEALVDRLPPHTRCVVCADDPRTAMLGSRRGDAVAFGLDDGGVALTGMPHAADRVRCRSCGSDLAYDRVYLAQLGRWHCHCGVSPLEPSVVARGISVRGLHGSSFSLVTPAGSARVQLALPGLYNVYNALAAATVGHVLGVTPSAVAGALSGVEPVFGRGEVVDTGAIRLVLLLAKNPTGMNEVLRAVLDDGGEHHDLVVLLNDSVYDGRDVSWIWDADFEQLAGSVRRVTCGGTRALDMAVRLTYAGLAPSTIAVETTVEGAIDAARASAIDQVEVLANYTAMLDVRDMLAERGEVQSIWR